MTKRDMFVLGSVVGRLQSDLRSPHGFTPAPRCHVQGGLWLVSAQSSLAQRRHARGDMRVMMSHTAVTSASPGRSPLGRLCQLTTERVTGRDPGGALHSRRGAEAADLRLQGHEPAGKRTASRRHRSPPSLRVRTRPGTSTFADAPRRTRPNRARRCPTAPGAWVAVAPGGGDSLESQRKRCSWEVTTLPVNATFLSKSLVWFREAP